MSCRAIASCGLIVALTILVLPVGDLCASERVAQSEPSQPVAVAEKKQVMVEFQFVQIDDPIAGVSLRGAATVELGESGSPAKVEADAIEITTTQQKPAASGDSEEQATIVDLSQTEGVADGLGLGVHMISDKTVLFVRGRAIRFERSKIVDAKPAAGKTLPKDKGYKVLSSPRLLVLVGDAAEITMGSAVPYLVQKDDGCLELRHTKDASEGISVHVLVEKADDERVIFESVRTKLSMVAGRQPIEGVPFDVGRPIIRAMEVFECF